MEKVEQPQSASPSPRRRQFGLMQLMILVFLIAAGIVAWQRLTYVHPAHENPEYQKGAYTRTGSILFDQCRIKMDTVLRNDRDGAILVEDGFGNSQAKEAADVIGDQAQVLKKSGGWMDTAEIQLSVTGGSIEVPQVLVFDSRSRRRINEQNDNLFGAWISGAETVQINRVGEKLPDRVDVLLRVWVYGEENTPTLLQPKVGATCKAPGGTVELLELHRGFQSYSQSTGVVTAPEEFHSSVALMLSFNGGVPPKDSFQIVAVKHDGTRALDPFAHCHFPGACIIGTGSEKKLAELVTIDAGLDSISHFELRPVSDRHSFFFDSVMLPQTSAAKFSPPPIADVVFSADEVEVRVPEFQPLDVRLTMSKGKLFNGIRDKAGWQNSFDLTLNPKGPEYIGTKSTLTARAFGISIPNPVFTLNPDTSKLNTSKDSWEMVGPAGCLFSRLYQVPIEEVKSVQMKLQ